MFLPLSSMCTFKVHGGECVFPGGFTAFTACFLLVWAWKIRVCFGSQTARDQKKLLFLWQWSLPKNLVGFCFIHWRVSSAWNFWNIFLISRIAWRVTSFFVVIGIFYLLSSFFNQCSLRFIYLIYLSNVTQVLLSFSPFFLFSFVLISIFIYIFYFLLYVPSICFGLNLFFFIQLLHFLVSALLFISIMKYLFHLSFIFYMRWTGFQQCYLYKGFNFQSTIDYITSFFFNASLHYSRFLWYVNMFLSLLYTSLFFLLAHLFCNCIVTVWVCNISY